MWTTLDRATAVVALDPAAVWLADVEEMAVLTLLLEETGVDDEVAEDMAVEEVSSDIMTDDDVLEVDDIMADDDMLEVDVPSGLDEIGW